jgi:hypothetical protein
MHVKGYAQHAQKQGTEAHQHTHKTTTTKPAKATAPESNPALTATHIFEK